MIPAYLRDQRGAAAAEFAIVLGLFTLALPSVVDVGIYAYDSMQVSNAAQAGAQAVWAACNQLPATSICASPGGAAAAQTAMSNAVQRTSLAIDTGNNVSAVEGYFCTDSTGALANAAANGNTAILWPTASAQSLNSRVPIAPSDCTAMTNPKTSYPGDYIKVTVSYTYAPVFGRVSVASLLGTPITSTAWVRLL